MTTIRRFCCNDLLRFASVNLDHLTETVSSPILIVLIFLFFFHILAPILSAYLISPFFFFESG